MEDRYLDPEPLPDPIIKCPCCGVPLYATEVFILNDLGDVVACENCVRDYYDERFQDWLAEQYKTAVCYWLEGR